MEKIKKSKFPNPKKKKSIHWQFQNHSLYIAKFQIGKLHVSLGLSGTIKYCIHFTDCEIHAKQSIFIMDYVPNADNKSASREIDDDTLLSCKWVQAIW